MTEEKQEECLEKILTGEMKGTVQAIQKLKSPSKTEVEEEPSEEQITEEVEKIEESTIENVEIETEESETTIEEDTIQSEESTNEEVGESTEILNPLLNVGQKLKKMYEKPPINLKEVVEFQKECRDYLSRTNMKKMYARMMKMEITRQMVAISLSLNVSLAQLNIRQHTILEKVSSFMLYRLREEDIFERSKISNMVKVLSRMLEFTDRYDPHREFITAAWWEAMVTKLDKYYDLAIDYLGYGHFLTSVIAAKVNARRKAMWIHDEKVDWLKKVKPWIKDYDKLFCVGKSCMNNIAKNNPQIKNKLEVFYNMTDYENVRNKAKEKTEIKFKKNVCNIITVGRLEWQKAYDVAIQIAAELKKRDFKFNWYVIGGGTKEEELKEMVKDNKLEREFIFLGMITNPFPVVEMADLYVLSSRHVDCITG